MFYCEQKSILSITHYSKINRSANNIRNDDVNFFNSYFGSGNHVYPWHYALEMKVLRCKDCVKKVTLQV